MKHFIGFCFLSMLFLSSCKETPNSPSSNLSILVTLVGEEGFNFNESLESWNSMKSEYGNSYIYQTESRSWDLYGSTTEIGIENGVVTHRAYESYELVLNEDQDGLVKVIRDTFYEDASSIGSNQLGAPAVLIDQIYDSCASYLSLATEENAPASSLFFETTSEGLLTGCSYWPVGIQDGTPYSVNISAFEWVR